MCGSEPSLVALTGAERREVPLCSLPLANTYMRKIALEYNFERVVGAGQF